MTKFRKIGCPYFAKMEEYYINVVNMLKCPNKYKTNLNNAL